jgi:hypothetical protein
MLQRHILTIALSAAATLACLPVLAEKEAAPKGVSADAKVLASPEITYKALRSMRDEDPSGCRVLSSNENESIIEEEFDGLPVIGKAICVYRETYEPQKKVSFKMIRSDKLKAFEGEWTLQSVDNGSHTLVRLQSYIDSGIKVPFAKQITEMANSGEIKQQVADLKKSAEQKQKQFAAKSSNASI